MTTAKSSNMQSFAPETSILNQILSRHLTVPNRGEFKRRVKALLAARDNTHLGALPLELFEMIVDELGRDGANLEPFEIAMTPAGHVRNLRRAFYHRAAYQKKPTANEAVAAEEALAEEGAAEVPETAEESAKNEATVSEKPDTTEQALTAEPVDEMTTADRTTASMENESEFNADHQKGSLWTECLCIECIPKRAIRGYMVGNNIGCLETSNRKEDRRQAKEERRQAKEERRRVKAPNKEKRV